MLMACEHWRFAVPDLLKHFVCCGFQHFIRTHCSHYECCRTPSCYIWHVAPVGAFPNDSWVSMSSGTTAYQVAAVTAQGRAYTVGWGGPSPNPTLQPGSSWRTATTSPTNPLLVGIDTSGRFLGDPRLAFTVPGNRPLLALAMVHDSDRGVTDLWYVTTDGLGFIKADYVSDSSSRLAFTHVHAVCAGFEFACFLTTGGRAVCTDASIFPPGGLEPLVEIACSGGLWIPKFACGLTATGDIVCFGPGAPMARTNSLKFESLSIASSDLAPSRVFGITVSGELRFGAEFERVLGPPNATWQMLATTAELYCSV